MIRSGPEGSFVWFRLDVKPGLKISWPVEIYLLYAKEARAESEFRLQLWDQGEISELTEQDRHELGIRDSMPLKLKKEKDK